MEHFIAYHSAERMGYRYEPSDDLNFLSTKKGLLNRAQGNYVWCIEGVSKRQGTEYSLHGVYLADKLESADPKNASSDVFVIHGPQITKFSPPLLLNHFDWFKLLRKSQGNFGLGFNRINDESSIHALEAILTCSEETDHLLDVDNLQDTDRLIVTQEGAHVFTSHLRRERKPLLSKAKKAVTLKEKGSLACEACGFDFSVVYGPIGKEYCEAHHIRPLATYSEEGEVSTLDELAILCSNCHRMIHRSSPMLSVAELSAIIHHNQN